MFLVYYPALTLIAFLSSDFTQVLCVFPRILYRVVSVCAIKTFTPIIAVCPIFQVGTIELISLAIFKIVFHNALILEVNYNVLLYNLIIATPYCAVKKSNE